ncbi:MAG: hypothetical protein HQ567_17080 [Candidatus Nealsonbacteria bacterium]|nr:hypothetical protein [Candidatus Nealsonbacteria bacterium]
MFQSDGEEEEQPEVGVDTVSLTVNSIPYTAQSFDSVAVASQEMATRFTDWDLFDAIHRQLGLLPSDVFTLSHVENDLTTLSADSQKIDSLYGLQGETSLQSLSLIPGDLTVARAEAPDLAQLDELTGLTSLTLQGCNLTDSDLSALGGLTALTGLESLDLRHNQIVADLPSGSLSALTALTDLDLRYNRVNVLPAAIADLPALEQLYLYGNPIDSPSPRAGLGTLAGKLVNIDLPPDHPDEAKSIEELADRLYGLPIKMYEYVLNTIEFQPYQGAMKGPLATLQTRAGNDWDTASLLAALFEEVGISSEYHWGQVAQPIETMLDYLGVRSTEAAYIVLGDAGLVSDYLDDEFESCDVVDAEYLGFTRAWLAVEPVEGEWFYLDPAWKLRDLRPGLPNLLDDLPFDDEMAELYLSEPREELAYEFYLDQVRQYLATDPDLSHLTVADVPYRGPIRTEVVDSLPTSLPHSDVDEDSSSDYPTIPTTRQHGVGISLAVVPESPPTIATATWSPTSGETTLTTAGTFPDAGPIVINWSGGPQAFSLAERSSDTSVIVSGDASGSIGKSFSTVQFTSLHDLRDIGLQRITIHRDDADQKIKLYLDGEVAATSQIAFATETSIQAVIEYFPGDDPYYQYAQAYTRSSDDVLAIGLDGARSSHRSRSPQPGVRLTTLPSRGPTPCRLEMRTWI